MALYHSERLRRGRTGTYLGIFASAYISLFLGGLLAEQMGVTADVLDLVLFVVPLVLFVGVGLAAVADDAREYFTAGRNVAAFFSGLSLAVTSLGGVGVVCITGALFKIGVDALGLIVGWVTGLVLAGVLLFPFLRKCGAYSVSSFLGLRLDSRVVRMLSAVLLVGPTALLLAAELSVAGFIAGWMTGQPAALMVVAAAALATGMVVTGGMRALTWVSVAQAIVALLAMAVPATIVSLLISNLPIPQLMHGNVVRAFSRIEAGQVFQGTKTGTFAFQMPGAGLDAFTGPFMQAFAHVGRLGLPLAIMVIATGLAGLPAVLNRAGTTTTIYETRKSMGWAVLQLAFMLLTLASIAGFLRGYLADQVVNVPGDRVPGWFQALAQSGMAEVGRTQAALALAGIQFKRDAAFIALPMAAGLPRVLVVLAAMGALAAALAGASAQIAALAGLLSEDLLHGGRREPPEDGVRLWSARIATAVAGGSGMVLAWMVSDPLAVALAALALSSATAFPVLVLSILWRKVSRFGAVAGMLTGFGITAVLMFGSATGMLSGAPLLAAAIGGPANMIVMAVLSQASPLVTRRALEMVRDLRLPGGEAIYDREMRMLRRKRASP